jgi:hypothetical protein
LKTAGGLAACLPFLPEDLDFSGKVNPADVQLLRGAIESGSYVPEFDLNRDGVLDAQDIEQVQAHRGERAVRYAAHYYPWWGNGLQPPFHWSQGVTYEPVRGQYNSRDPALAYDQIQSACSHGLDTFLIEWIGPASTFQRREADRTVELALQEGFLPALESAGGAARFAINYDAAIIFRRAFGFSMGHFDFSFAVVRERFLSDLLYLRDRYFGHPQYLKIEGRPLLHIYLTREFVGDYALAFDQVHAQLDGQIYLVGDEVWPGGETDLTRSSYLDAVTAYNFYGADWLEPVGFSYGAYTDMTEAILRTWRHALGPVTNRYTGEPVRLVPGAIPDFNDTGLINRNERNRPLVFGPDPAAEFGQQIARLRPLVDRRLNLMVITSYNEFHEGTSVEEAREYGTSRLAALQAQKRYARSV